MQDVNTLSHYSGANMFSAVPSLVLLTVSPPRLLPFLQRKQGDKRRYDIIFLFHFMAERENCYSLLSAPLTSLWKYKAGFIRCYILMKHSCVHHVVVNLLFLGIFCHPFFASCLTIL